jgi:hypothetical protein
MIKTISLKKLFLSAVAVILFSLSASSQLITGADKKKLQIKEDSLSQIARFMILDSIPAGRVLAYKDFVPTLLRALKIKNSFYFPFDSVQGISKLYAPDSSFRIFTWYVEIDDYKGWQRGFIQMRTANGTLKGYPLFDNSDFTESPNEIVCRDSTWIGAVYYNIIKTQHQGKNYYTLFGFDRHAIRSNKKWIEVLTFNEKKEPVFGGPFFSFQEDSIKKPTQYRFSIEYKEEARTLVNYQPELELILVDHLISETEEPEFPWTMIPDGDYEGFKWQNGKWVHIDKVFTFKLKDGEAPVEDPILDIKGNKDEKKLQEKSDKSKPGKSGGG